MAKNPKRPDITYPCPDPEKEPVAVEYKVGQRVQVRPHVHYHGTDLSGKTGTIRDTKSYIMVEFELTEKYTDKESGEQKEGKVSRVLKMLRYEIEPALPDPWAGTLWDSTSTKF